MCAAVSESPERQHLLGLLREAEADINREIRNGIPLQKALRCYELPPGVLVRLEQGHIHLDLGPPPPPASLPED